MKTSKYGFTSVVTVVVAVALDLLTLAGPATAGPQATTTYGDPFTWMGAEAAAMGGTGVAVYRGGLSNVFNPAFLVVETDKRLDAGVMLDQEHEDRLQPLYDSFNSWVADVSIASNRHHFWQTGFGFAKRVGSGPRAVAIGLSLTDRFPWGYAFSEEIRNPSPFLPRSASEPQRDIIVAMRERQVTGALRALSFGVAAETSERISVGTAIHYNYGTRRDVASSLDLDHVGTNDSWRDSDELKLAGVSVSAGLRARCSERLDLGFAVESGIRASGDWRQQHFAAAGATDTTQGSFQDYPWCARAGLAFRPRNELPTVLTLEIEYRPWSDLRDGTLGADVTPILNDAADVRLGVEHTFYNGMPLRFGFRHLASYADRDAAVTAFTAGTAARVGEGRLNASVELAKTSNELRHQFPYPTEYFGTAYYVSGKAMVDDTRFRVGVSYTMEF
jgi:hypothetical protein